MSNHQHHEYPPWVNNIDSKLDLLLEGMEEIMSTLDDLNAQLAVINTKVATVKIDVETLLAKLASVPPAGLTPTQQAALDSAVKTAQGIATSLGAIDTEANAPLVVPVLKSIAPATGPVIGGTPITLTGTGFTGATSVTIGGAHASNVVVVNDTTITAVSPIGTGTVAVVVATLGGVSDGSVMFAFSGAVQPPPPVVPVLASISPTNGPVAGGTSVTLTGTGFTGATSVTIAGTATPFTVVDDKTITLVTPAGVVGGAAVVVTSPTGVSDGTVVFTYA